MKISRRKFLAVSGAVAMPPSMMSAQPSTPEAEVPQGRMWEFVRFSANPWEYITVERYWYESDEDALEAVFDDEPLQSRECPVEDAKEFPPEVHEDSIRSWFGNLWGEDIEVVQFLCAVDNFVWIVTVDATVSNDTAYMVVKSVFEFDRPRVPRGWSLNRERDIR